MNVPPKGTMARDMAEANVHLRRISRTMVHVPRLGPAPLGLLAGGVYRAFVFLGICQLVGIGLAVAYLLATGQI